MSFQHIGDIAVAGLPLKQNRGRSGTIISYGIENMRERLAQRSLSADHVQNLIVNAQTQYWAGSPICESPIERMTLAALVTSDWRTDAETLVLVALRQDEVRPACELVIVPQFSFIRCRLDFAVTVLREDGSFRLWAVECDGQEYHRDTIAFRKRDRFLTSWGIEVFHLTGSEIYKEVHAQLSPLVHAINSWRASGERAPLV